MSEKTGGNINLAGEKAWWQKPYRMVQTNLRQPDALYDQKALARETREFGANVLLYNIGGIYAFYPTDLPLHARNPMMKGDALGDAIEAAHQEGLALVGRFDMSKATRIAYEAHPEWFVHNRQGRPLEYNGTYQACVNGGWYQQYAFDIISEALGRYDVDGVFFNMFGYRTTTYSGEDFGICVCENCQRRFRQMYGKALPEREDFACEAYPDYVEFKDRTSRELSGRIYDHIKAVNPRVAMSGQRGKNDFIRMEVQRAVDRTQPEWPYQSGEQARWARAYAPEKMAASTATNFIDFAWRFVSETGAYQELRMAQQLASGATLDYYLLGVMDQQDKKAFPAIERLYKWHARNEEHYTGLSSAARVGLYHSFGTNAYRGRTDARTAGAQAFRGAYRMLLEARIPFDFISDEKLAETDLDRYRAIVMPNVACISDGEAATLDAWVKAGGLLIATGETGLYDERGVRREKPALESLPIRERLTMRRDMRGAYFEADADEAEKTGAGLYMLDGVYHACEPRDGAMTLLKLLPPQRFGPPELCFPEVESEESSRESGGGRLDGRRLSVRRARPGVRWRRAASRVRACAPCRRRPSPRGRRTPGIRRAGRP